VTGDGTPILEVRDLVKRYAGRRSVPAAARRQPPPLLVALDEVSLALDRKETLGIVGESGSGKSTLAHCLVRLVEPDRGEVRLDGVDVLTADRNELRRVRRRIQLVYQDPYSSLNPRLTVGAAIGEPARVHDLVDRSAQAAFVAELLERVGLSPADAHRRPRQLSGGQRQRVAIARALAVRPEILVADEPVSALDVSIQAQILGVFEQLTNELDLAMILISHDLAIIAHLAERVAVMYLGRIVETGPTRELFANPRHPYTAALIAAHPRIGRRAERRRPALRGELPSPFDIPSGCRFRTRCPLAAPICEDVDPPPVEVAPGHVSRCHVLAPAEPR
jgi:oligopeptide/dipeptide ABC transporter ATP-binding protein